MAFRPYLFFGGNCREAFTRYQDVFGGEPTFVTMKDVPGEEAPPEATLAPRHTVRCWLSVPAPVQPAPVR